MPVRSLSSPVLKWPEAQTVLAALDEWAHRQLAERDLLRLGYFGSFAHGDSGVGSDLDLVAVVEHSALAFERRGLDWDLLALPVPADLLVYTRDEWNRLLASGSRFARVMTDEVIWLTE